MIPSVVEWIARDISFFNIIIIIIFVVHIHCSTISRVYSNKKFILLIFLTFFLSMMVISKSLNTFSYRLVEFTVLP